MTDHSMPQQATEATKTAYSVEEHMFNQDEIQRRHQQQPPDQQPVQFACTKCGYTGTHQSHAGCGYLAVIVPTDQQRSDAVTELQFHACPSCGGLVACNVEDQSAAIAERDATIAALRAAGKTAVRLIHSKEEQIARLEAEIAELKGKQ